ncbi:MAG: DUF2489 domain-containing protein [Halomonadaceae bacterium]|nr:MAG: DUF2489 domain-containing protein [Halomonadaceae bacterium]
MSVVMQWVLIALGLAASAGLLWYILSQMKQHRAVQRSREKTRALQQQRRESMIESIQLLAMTAEQEQVEYSEACIRIKGLLDHVAPQLLSQEPYTVFQLMYEKTEHMPTHQARKQADQALIRQLDEERFALEKEHGAAIHRAAVAIRQHDLAAEPGPTYGEASRVKSTLS